MTLEGSLLCSVSDRADSVGETSLAAISSSIMNNYIQGGFVLDFLHWVCQRTYVIFSQAMETWAFML